MFEKESLVKIEALFLIKMSSGQTNCHVKVIHKGVDYLSFPEVLNLQILSYAFFVFIITWKKWKKLSNIGHIVIRLMHKKRRRFKGGYIRII
jgi:hypothetical protein